MQNIPSIRCHIVEYYISSLFFLLQIAVLLNLVLHPYSPLVALISILAIFVISSLFSKKLLLCFLLFSIFSSETLYIEIGSAVVRVVDIFILYMLSYLSIKWLLNPKSNFESLPILKSSLFLLILGALVSFVNTFSTSNSILELIQITELIIAAHLFYNLISNENEINYIFVIVLIYSVLDSLWILYQHTTGQLIGRHVGLFGTFASELGYGLVLSASYFYIVQKKSLKLVILLIGMIQIIAIYLTKGRGLLITAILMTTVCNLLFAIDRKRLFPFILVSGAITFASVISYFGISSDIQRRVASIVEGGQMRDLRLIIWAIALKTWKQYPIFGVGFGNAELALEMFAPKPFGIAFTALTNVKTPHNEYLSFAMQGGIIGFAIGLFFYFNLMRRAIVSYLKSVRLKSQAIIVFSFVVGLVFLNFANDNLLAGNGMIVMLFIALISRIYVLAGNHNN